jgi:hypothetical protein
LEIHERGAMLQKSEDLNQFKSNYSVFMRSSRDVSRQGLFFLSILRKTNQKKIDAILTEFSEYALIKVKALTNGVKVPNKDDTDASDRIKKNLYYWQKKIREKLDNVKTLSLENVPDLKERFVTFLKITREDDIKQCLQHHIIPFVPRSKWHNEGKLTWVFSRNAIYGFEKLLDRFNPRLYVAVRASANFPFGFPLVEIETDASLMFNPNDEKSQQGLKSVKLTDGGVLSNSGMWSLFGLLMKNAPELKKRGVLLIVVEASKMPEYRDMGT